MGRTFSWSRAALAGFDVLRREPGLLLTWSLVGLVLAVAQQVIAANAGIFRAVNPVSLTAVALGLAGGVISLGALAIFSAAAYRAVLLPEDRSRARLRFGAEEIRLALVWLVQGVLIVVPFFVSVVPTVIATTGLAMRGSMVPGFATLAAFLVAVFVSGFLLARLSVAGPMSLIEGGWSLPAAWRLTRGRAWKIAGVHLCVVLMATAVYWGFRAAYALCATSLGGTFSLALTPVPPSVAAVFTPERLAFAILSAVLGAASAAVLYAPAAAIYRDLKGLTPDDQAAVFD